MAEIDMLTVQKLKYDLSLQCAALEILWNRYTETTPPDPDYDIRTDIMDKLANYYMHFSVLGQTRFEDLLNKLRASDKLEGPNMPV